MKKLKLGIVAVLIIAFLHTVIVLALSNKNIFPCQTKPVVLDMEKLEWKDSKCDVNPKHWVGSVQRLTPGAAAVRVGLIYVLPTLIAAGVMYGLHMRKKRIVQ